MKTIAFGPLMLVVCIVSPPRFDPDTAVPSRRDGQVEAFSACLAAQSTLQEALLASMRGDNGQVHGMMHGSYVFWLAYVCAAVDFVLVLYCLVGWF